MSLNFRFPEASSPRETSGTCACPAPSGQHDHRAFAFGHPAAQLGQEAGRALQLERHLRDQHVVRVTRHAPNVSTARSDAVILISTLSSPLVRPDVAAHLAGPCGT